MTQVHEIEQSTSEANGLGILQGLYAWIQENAGKVEAHEAERHILNRVLAVGLAAIGDYFKQKGTGDVGPILVDAEGHEYHRHPQIQSKVYISIFGKTPVDRTGYHSPGRQMLFPLDADANLPKLRFSYPLQDLVNDFGSSGPFRDAMDKLKKWRGEGVWDHSAEQISRDSAEDYDAYYESKPDPTPAPEEENLIISMDGKGVPMIKKEAAKIRGKLNKGEKRQKKKESNVGVCYTIAPMDRTAEGIAENLVYPERAKERRKALGLPPEARPKANAIRRMASLKKSKEEVAVELLEEAEKRDPEHVRALCILIDGDPALENVANKVFTAWPEEQRFLILDIIHVRHYLWKAAHALYGEGSTDAADYVLKQLVKILKGQVNGVICGMMTSLGKRKLKGNKAKTIKDAVRYFRNHRHMMQYDVYLHWGFPIATGVVESTCKSLVKSRMEGCGMRWSLIGAESMLQLRSIYMSRDWDDYWEYRISRERERRYGGTLRVLQGISRKTPLRKAG